MWRLSVERPDLGAGIGDNIYALVQLSHGAIATSGDYRNYKTDGEKHYSHVIDPRTGSPTTNRVASVTVIAESCMVADALATAVMVLGPDDGVKLVEKFEGAETMVVVRSGSREYTDQRSQGFDRCIYKY